MPLREVFFCFPVAAGYQLFPRMVNTFPYSFMCSAEPVGSESQTGFIFNWAAVLLGQKKDVDPHMGDRTCHGTVKRVMDINAKCNYPWGIPKGSKTSAIPQLCELYLCQVCQYILLSVQSQNLFRKWLKRRQSEVSSSATYPH